MLYHCGNPILDIQTVGRFAWKARALSVEPRPFCALAFRLQGSGTLYCGGKHYELTPGCVLYMPQGAAYRHDYTDTDLLLFHFTTLQDDPEPEVYRLQNPDGIGSLFQKALAVWEEKGPGYQAVCMSLLYRIISLLAQNEAAVRLPPHFLQSVRLLHDRFRDSTLRIGDICREAGIGQTVFRQLFRQHYGKTPVDYLTDLRMEHARNLIAAGSSVESAAFDSGFADAKYFSRVVRRKHGCTPRQWKPYG